ncbi:hypothetical protein GCM10010306_062690 [Streptomyces umbrinus]|nr:hypothetical protein GCM10010306_062690 [Streptomyces umbrinus]
MVLLPNLAPQEARLLLAFIENAILAECGPAASNRSARAAGAAGSVMRERPAASAGPRPSGPTRAVPPDEGAHMAWELPRAPRSLQDGALGGGYARAVRGETTRPTERRFGRAVPDTVAQAVELAQTTRPTGSEDARWSSYSTRTS